MTREAALFFLCVPPSFALLVLLHLQICRGLLAAHPCLTPGRVEAAAGGPLFPSLLADIARVVGCDFGLYKK